MKMMRRLVVGSNRFIISKASAQSTGPWLQRTRWTETLSLNWIEQYKFPGFLATRCVLAATPDLHDMRFFSFAAVFTTVLAAFFGRTVAGAVGTLCSRFFGHQSKPPLRSGRSRFNRLGDAVPLC